MTAVQPPPIYEPRHPLGVVITPYGQDAGVADLYRGAQCFFVASGPSTRTMPLHLLARRGCLVFCCNNSPGCLPEGVRPHIWTHTDDCHKFHDSIWRDPAVLKFTPYRCWAAWQSEEFPMPKHKAGNPIVPKGIRRRHESGLLGYIPGLRAMDCPGTFGYHRNTTFNPDTFLTEPSINRGNCKKSAAQNGWPNTINTMFTVLRLAYYLGIETLYLVGCDFHMDKSQPYGMAQRKDHAGDGDNHAYRNMARMFTALLPHFERAGFNVLNATPGSRLDVFPRIAFEEAVERATATFEQTLNCEGWYEPRDYRSYRPHPAGH